jgi:hypothetical protein
MGNVEIVGNSKNRIKNNLEKKKDNFFDLIKIIVKICTNITVSKIYNGSIK